MADVCSIMFKYVKDSVKESLIPLAGLKSSTRGGTPRGAGGLLTCPGVQGASLQSAGRGRALGAPAGSPHLLVVNKERRLWSLSP